MLGSKSPHELDASDRCCTAVSAGRIDRSSTPSCQSSRHHARPWICLPSRWTSLDGSAGTGLHTYEVQPVCEPHSLPRGPFPDQRFFAWRRHDLSLDLLWCHSQHTGRLAAQWHSRDVCGIGLSCRYASCRCNKGGRFLVESEVRTHARTCCKSA